MQIAHRETIGHTGPSTLPPARRRPRPFPGPRAERRPAAKRAGEDGAGSAATKATSAAMARQPVVGVATG